MSSPRSGTGTCAVSQRSLLVGRSARWLFLCLVQPVCALFAFLSFHGLVALGLNHMLGHCCPYRSLVSQLICLTCLPFTPGAVHVVCDPCLFFSFSWCAGEGHRVLLELQWHLQLGFSPLWEWKQQKPPGSSGKIESGGRDLTTYAGHLREKRASFSWGFPEVCPSSCSRHSCQRIKVLDSSLPILECARNARTEVSSPGSAVIRKKT